MIFDDEATEDELAALVAGTLDHPDDDDVQTLVIIGNGMTSYRLCRKLVEHGVQMHSRIVVFGEERHPAYDRVHLTDIFVGTPPEKLILAEEDWYEANGIELYLGNPVVHIDREQSIVEAASGDQVPYNRLVFATGCEPFVPPIEGLRVPDEHGNLKLQKHVFLYRTFDDVYTIEAELEQTSRAVIMGGGMIGLEAAKAVYELGRRMHVDIQVIVMEEAPRLMPRQLDDGAAGLLKVKIEQLGVYVHVGEKITRVAYDENTDRLTIHFDEGATLETNMLIVSVGIRPRSELAKAAGIECASNGGIKVDDQLRTSDEQIYAIGVCAAHNEMTYGLVGPGYQMVDVLVANLMGENARFTGADQSAKLNLLGVTVAFFGEYDGDTKPSSSALRYTTGGVYRKLVTRKGHLIGVIAVGDWDELYQIRKAILAPGPMSFWDMRRFRSTGNLFSSEKSKDVTEWADDAIVCVCARITLGQLSNAIAAGASTVGELSKRTGAGESCGVCNHLLAELMDGIERETKTNARQDTALASRDRAPVRGPNLLRRDRPAPMSNRPGYAAPVSVRRPGLPAPQKIITGFQSMIMPGQTPAGPYRTGPELPGSVIKEFDKSKEFDESIDNLYSSDSRGKSTSSVQNNLGPWRQTPKPSVPQQPPPTKPPTPIDVAPTMADITAAEFEPTAQGGPPPAGPKGTTRK